MNMNQTRIVSKYLLKLLSAALLVSLMICVISSCNSQSPKSDYEVEIVKTSFEEGIGSDYFYVRFKFTNNSNKEISFNEALELYALQDGVEVKQAYDYSYNADKKVEAGASYEFRVQYYVTFSDPIKIKVYDKSNDYLLLEQTFEVEDFD